MSDFRDSLRKVSITIDGRTFDAIGASFRGVPFFVEASERSGGRRVVVHEFPGRDDPFIEDLGGRARKFRIEGYVIGADYVAQRDRLLAALEDEEGPGQLVHPYYGLKTAIGETTSTRETRAEGGWAAISIEFCEAPAQTPTPQIVDDLPAKVSDAADVAQIATNAQLATDYDASGLPSFALASCSAAISKAAGFVGSHLAAAVSDTQELASLNGTLNTIVAQSLALARSPATLLTQVRTAIATIVTTIADSPGAVYDALVAAYGEALATPVIGSTTTRQREASNQTALVAGLRRVIAIEAARLAPTVPYASIEDATAARDQVAAILDEQAATAGDTAYPALVDLRAQVMRAVPGSDAFPRVTAISRRGALPSLVLAYQLYGSVDLEPDVVARNRVQHPGFIAGALKVLSSS